MRVALVGIVAALVLAAPVQSAARRPGVKLVKVGTFKEPIYATSPPRDKRRLFVAEQRGVIWVVRDGKRLKRPFLDIRGKVRSVYEIGLLSLAFAPDYAASGRFYVYYTDQDVNQHVVEYRAAGPNRADPGSARELLVMDDPDFNNNGGQLQFGPDGLLYIANGDGGHGEESENAPGDPFHTAQDLGSLFGKILRIDPAGESAGEYGIPEDNPYQDDGQRPEIFAYGLRNPWRFSFDRRTGDLVIADVGQSQQEEVDYFKRGGGRGANLGWPVYEGRARRRPEEKAPDYVAPVLTVKHPDFCALVGGVVVRDPKLKALTGRYVFGDFCSGQIRSTKLRRPRASARAVGGIKVPELDSFGQDGRGRVYAVSIDGPVYRLAAR
jgi:glucose/arabinose dehydrogenase